MEKEVETSPQLALIRLSYYFLTVIPESRIIKYGGDSRSSDDWELLSDRFDNCEVADFMIVETGSGILLMVPRTRKSLCLIDTRVHGRKGS